MPLINGVLTPKQVEKGFLLRDDEKFIYLHYKTTVAARFNSRTATFQEIKQEVHQQEEWLKSGVTFEEVMK